MRRDEIKAEALTLPSDLIRSLEAKIVDLERRDREIVLPEAASTDAELSILKAAEAEVDRAKSSPWRHVEAVALKVLGFFATTTPVPPTPIVEAIESLIPLAEKHGGGLEDSERALEQAREKLATARERAATVTRERERLTLEQGRIRNDLTGARRELAKAREDRQIEPMRRDEIKAVVIAALRAGRQAAEAEVDRIVLGSPGAWYVNGELVTTDSGDGLDPRDGGTCNFDDVVLRLPRTCPSRVVSEWIAEAYYDTKEREPRKWFGRGWFVLAGNAGHAGLNTRCRDAFQRAAEAEVAKRGAGGVVKFSGYFQAD